MLSAANDQGEAEVAAPHMTTGSTRRTLLGLAISAVSLLGVAWWAQGQELPSFPSTPSKRALVGVGIVVYAVATLARGIRWHVILRRSGVSHRPADALGVTTVGYMGNVILPARGGEVFRILLMADRSSARRLRIAGTIVAERLLDAVTLAFLFVALVTLSSASDELRPFAAAAAIGLMVLTGVVALYLHLRRRGRLAAFSDFVRPVALASRLLLGSVGFGLVAFTVCVWLLESVVLWLVASSLELSLAPVESLYLVVLTSVALSVPAAPAYIGTFDAALLFGLSRLGFDASDSLACALLWRFVLFVPITLAGLALVVFRYGGLSQLRIRLKRPEVRSSVSDKETCASRSKPAGRAVP